MSAGSQPVTTAERQREQSVMDILNQNRPSSQSAQSRRTSAPESKFGFTNTVPVTPFGLEGLIRNQPNSNQRSTKGPIS